VVAIIATTSAVTAIRLSPLPGIGFSLGVFGNFLTVYLAAYFVEVSQVMPTHASIGLFRGTKPSMIDAGDSSIAAGRPKD
jgi:hypothetical protein